MNLSEAKSGVKRLLSAVDPAQLPAVLHWIRTSGQHRKCSLWLLVCVVGLLCCKLQHTLKTLVPETGVI